MGIKKIRRGVFEANSSSSHSLTINANDFLMDTIIPDDSGYITIEPGQFGWEWEKYNDALTKASYCLTGTLYVGDRTEEALTNLYTVIKNHTRCYEVLLELPNDDWNSPGYGYIDHQSVEGGEMNNLLFDTEKLHNFIFNKNSWLFLGNDNSSPPNKFYDTSALPYKWRLVFPDYPITQWEFLEYPTKDALLKVVENMDIRFLRVDDKYIVEERPNYWLGRCEYFEFKPKYYEDKTYSGITDSTISFISNKDETTSLLINYRLVEIK